MKKILWICNIMLPVIAKELKLPYSNREGWLTGIFNALTDAKGDREMILGICFPVEKKEEQICLTIEGVRCYGFYENLSLPEKYDCAMEGRFAEIFKEFEPDIIHIFGTEFPHALAAAKAFGKPDRTLLCIQGLCYEIAKVYMANLPETVCNAASFRDLLRKDSLKRQQEKFVIRGEREKEVIRLSGHITGRTDFDREGTARINPNACYHAMDETMRNSFYSGQWKREQCRPHSIFLGQGDYPLKGFHFLLEAMPIILRRYPDAKIFVAGNSIIKNDSLKDKIKISAYGKYLLMLMGKYGLEDKVVALGKLSEQEMKEQFLKSEVFICPSILENSPNTIGEAMLLGVPVVAAKVGGIPDMITDGEDGLLFEGGDVMGLADAVTTIFDNEGDLTGQLSKAAKTRAQSTHDGTKNYQRLMEIYEIIGA